MKVSRIVALLCGFVVPMSVNSAVCGVQGNITSIIPSAGDAGLKMDVAITGCVCDHSVIWIDTDTPGGKAMYSAALSAKISGSRVLASIEDGKGQGAEGNNSITYRYWATCQLKALEVF